MSDFVNMLGFAAGICTTGAFIPQVIQTWRTRSTSDISFTMYAAITTGTLLWLGYGVINNDLPIVAANVVTACLQSIVLAFKIRHG